MFDRSLPPAHRIRSGSATARRRITVIVVLTAFAADTLAIAAVTRESAFTEETRVAMDRMMSAMESRPTGNVDRDFATMMIPHHQGAIEMAAAELRYGSNEPLRRLAQEIVVAQQQEIAVMRHALDSPVVSSAPRAALRPM